MIVKSIHKKAQVTLFVIIGIVVLIAAATFLFLRISSTQVPGEELITKTSDVPVEFQSINDFVESCVVQVGKEGIKKLGMHGGYIDLARYGMQASASNPTNSRAFLFNQQDPSSGVAYWHYFSSDNKCEQECECGSEQPYLYKSDGAPSIELQLENYVNENLDNCLNDFIAFKRQGFGITTLGDIKTTAQIRENDVLFLVDYKIEVKKDSSEFLIDQFIKTTPVELRKMYELANSLRLSELNFTFTEKWTLEQLAGFGLGVKSDRLPPIAASELDPGEPPVYWMKQKVRDDITNNVLPIYTPFFSVYGTRNYNNDMVGTFYQRATVPLLRPDGSDYSNLDVSFNYLNLWPIYFDITGRGVSGQRIGPETASFSLMSFIGIKKYNLYYDVSYPILIDIYSPSAFNNEGMHLYFGLESNVRNNRPLNCSGAGLTQYTVSSNSLFCNYNQGCANVTVRTVDAKTDAPLIDTAVYYSSGLESCDEGSTKMDGNSATVKASLPSCVGTACSIDAVKEGYWSYPSTYAARCSILGGICLNENVLCNGETVTIKLEPYRKSNITVMKKKMLKQAQKTWVFNNNAERLLENEFAFISLEKIKDNPNENDFSVAGVYYGNQSSVQLLPGLVPGDYQLRIDLFYQLPDSKGRDNIIFKEVRECQSTMLGLDKDCVDIGPYNFTSSFVEGGFFENITLTKDMLDSSNNLIFYALSSPDVGTSYDVLDVYDMDEMGKTETYSQEYKVELKPVVG